MPQDRLAYMLDVSQRTVLRWERGVTVPRGATRQRVLRRLTALERTSGMPDENSLREAAACIGHAFGLSAATVLDRVTIPRDDSLGEYHPLRERLLDRYEAGSAADVPVNEVAKAAGVDPGSVERLLTRKGHRPLSHVAVALTTLLDSAELAVAS